MNTLTDLTFKVRGVEDILITATDNLDGFAQTIHSVFLNLKPQYLWFIKLEMPINK